ncbi:MAG: ATP-binding cassette domain-containing protein [Desulfovibrio sp.]|jgi:phospholipid/cholesterol/gamma-HCH transport system ATP-binding protein|nr:ATP-binding cassette domain-containing protein [Desulfovibrio sp.]
MDEALPIADVSASSSSEAIIRLHRVDNRFNTLVVHENLDLDIRKGEILGIIGGSGTGKSILLRTILGLHHASAGEIFVMGVNMNTASEEKKKRIRKQWGVLFQDGALFSSLTVGENIAFPLREFTSVSKSMREAISLMKLDLVGLPLSAYDLYPGELSGGMKKRAGLARALALDPAILLLDEPTAGLDPLGAADFDRLLLGLRAGLGLTVCMVTHDLDSLHAVCDRVAVLAEKRIYAVDSIANLLHVKHPWIQEYFTGPRGRMASHARGLAALCQWEHSGADQR